MKRYKIIARLLLFFCFLSIGITTGAQVVLPAIFSNNMILQRGKPVPVWGKAAVGEKVTVSFANQVKKVIADSVGNWRVSLLAMKASFDPKELVVQASNRIVFKNILVGDIWLCSGQSNMEYTFDRKLKKHAAPKKGIDVAEEELSKSKPDGIRYIYVEKNLKKIPLLPTNGWTTGDDTTVRYASAIGYFFAKEIYENTNVPIGIISSSWGGTRIEQWVPEWSWIQSAVFKDSVSSPNFTIDGMHPGQMYKGLIEPLIPFAVKGVLWYQGESNCMIEDQVTYPHKMELLVNTWRTLFKDKNLPFYYVQISPYLYSSRKSIKQLSKLLLPSFWEAQTQSLSLKNTGMAVTTDLVDNLNDIHPSYKWEVAHRLALIALAKNYQQHSLEYSGPVFQSALISENKLELNFSHIGSGLVSNDLQPLTCFTIAADDGIFVSAEATILGNKIIVFSPTVRHPKYVRFAWDEKSQPNLFNKEGLPAVPFRTDHLKIN